MIPPPDSPYLSDASGFKGSADRIFFPASEAEVSHILRDAAGARTPVTIAGAGSGLTGGRVPLSGWVLSLERLNRVDVRSELALCGAGALLRDLQDAANRSGQFYPPDPTENSASVGGTIATNASGSRSFRYGDTRRYVRALRVVLASGELLDLHRGEKPPFEIPSISAPASRKNTAGYYMRPGMDFLDLFIGSEGTLGVIVEAELNLLRAPETLFTGVIFFGSDEAALDAVDQWRSIDGLRMLEYMDAQSLQILGEKACAALIIEQEAEDVEELWLARLEKAGADPDHSWFAASAADRERFRRFRHALPEAVNELVRKRGLTKMGSDFAVPISNNREMLRIYRTVLDREFPGRYAIFGHIGDAHLHVNILPANDEEWRRGKVLMLQFARAAVSLGGTVSAEHGLGKRKKDLLELQYSAADIEKMKAVKQRLDPDWVLGQGTLFDR